MEKKNEMIQYIHTYIHKRMEFEERERRVYNRVGLKEEFF